MAVSTESFVWALSFILIYWLFMRQNAKGEDYAPMGAIVMFLNCFLGYIILPESWVPLVIHVVVTVFALKLFQEYEMFQFHGGF